MKVSTKTRYAVRLIFQLALNYGKGPLMLGDIAKKEDLSEKYLSLIVIPLRAHGLVNSTRGAKGGYSIAKPPYMITIKDIFEATDGRICTVECAANEKKCKRLELCVIKNMWSMLDKQIEKALESVTVQDLVEDYLKKNQIVVNYEI